jgi:hypothetical protein
MKNNQFNNKEQFIYNLLFLSDKTFEINIDDFCEKFDRPFFKDEIRSIIKKGGKTIIDEKTINTETKTI